MRDSREPTEDDRTRASGVTDHGSGPDLHGEMPDLVVCFDRDATVSVSPPRHVEERAVPLAWVKFLAHDPRAANVDVWATGNQRLCGEAAIPGTAEAVACRERLLEEGLIADSTDSADSADGGYDHLDTDPPRPRRRDRLRIVADIYRLPRRSRSDPDESGGEDEPEIEGERETPAFVVVDDADLKDMHEEGFEHFLPWLFCALVVDTGGQPAVFESAGVSLPLEELPEPTDGEADDRSAATDDARSEAAFTNTPVDSDDDRTLRPSHYDPTHGEGPSARER